MVLGEKHGTNYLPCTFILYDILLAFFCSFCSLGSIFPLPPKSLGMVHIRL